MIVLKKYFFNLLLAFFCCFFFNVLAQTANKKLNFETSTVAVYNQITVPKLSLPIKPNEIQVSTNFHGDLEKLIQIGDEIEIDVLGSLDYDWRGQTDDSGSLSNLPNLNVSIPALCRTIENVEADVKTAYNSFLRDPQIVVRVLDRSKRQPALILGAIRSPQQFRIERSVQLNELIVLSGGITDKASGLVRILRPPRVACLGPGQIQTELEEIKIKLVDLLSGLPAANRFIHSGDVITVEESSIIYLIVNFSLSRRIPLRQGMTLERVLAAGGLSGNLQNAKITIFRRRESSSETETIQTNLNKMKASKDFELQANDVIEISFNNRSNSPKIIYEAEQSESNPIKLPVRVIN